MVHHFFIKLHHHEKNADVYVVGVPDIKYGEELCAWVKMKPDQTMTEQEVKDFCKGKIAHFKIPRYVMFVDDFPMGVTGMVTIGGVLPLALPSAILAAGFMEERQKEQTSHNHYGTEAGISLLERVGTLKERGLITEEEFEEYKALILPRLREHEGDGGEK